MIITSDPDDPLRIFLSPPTLPNLSINTTNTATAHGGLNVSNHPYCYGSEASSVHSLSPINSFGANSSFGGSRCGSDDANSPLTPSNSSTMSLRDSLRKKLREERIECPRGSGAYIIPRCQQKLLITEDAIKDEARLKGVVIEVEKAQSIREHSMRLFGILAYLRRGAQIVDFMAENITDEQLPLKRDMEDYRNYCLKGPKGETIRLLAERWDDDEREDFYEAQRMMTAPFFELHQHYEFDDSTVLPFIDFAIADGETKEYRGGGYSEIHIRCIHPSHHNFWDRSQPDVSAMNW